jgi:hypothetical protein
MKEMNIPITFPNLLSCTQYNLKAELKWNDEQILDCEGEAIPALESASFWTHPSKFHRPQLEEIETGTDFITLNFTGTCIDYHYRSWKQKSRILKVWSWYLAK